MIISNKDRNYIHNKIYIFVFFFFYIDPRQRHPRCHRIQKATNDIHQNRQPKNLLLKILNLPLPSLYIRNPIFHHNYRHVHSLQRQSKILHNLKPRHILRKSRF